MKARVNCRKCEQMHFKEVDRALREGVEAGITTVIQVLIENEGYSTKRVQRTFRQVCKLLERELLGKKTLINDVERYHKEKFGVDVKTIPLETEIQKEF